MDYNQLYIAIDGSEMSIPSGVPHGQGVRCFLLNISLIFMKKKKKEL